MASPGTQSGVIRFGPFEFDPVNRELRNGRIAVKLQPQQFAILALLVQRAGQIVSREEIHQHIWGNDTFVDFERGINFSINQIRAALGDSAESPHFIETLPRRGYRFIGELEPPVQSVVNVEPDDGAHSRQTWLRIAAGVFVLAVVALAAPVIYRSYRQQRPQEQTAFNALPFTALPGEETSPAFSPDGSRIAFAWNGDPVPGGKGFDLYVKAIGSETLLRLTRHPSELISPAWSPDGTQIAFHRMDGAETGIYVVPVLGGLERKLRSSRISWEPFTDISWSPDGKWIAFSDILPKEEHAAGHSPEGDGKGRIYLLSTETMESKGIPNSEKCLGQGQPAFSHRGDYLAYWCIRTHDEFALCSLSLASGEAKVFPITKPRTYFSDYPAGLTWSADDTALIYSLGVGFLGAVTVANGSLRQFALAGNVERPTVSPKGDKVAFSSFSANPNIWRRDLLHLESPAVELIPSTRGQQGAEYSPDGKRIGFESERSGVPGVWISNKDGSNPVQISNPHDISGSPQWSPDGKKIAFASHPLDRWEIYVADATEGIPWKLVTNISGIYEPRWSRDGKWIYFRSSEVGRAGLYRCPASGGGAIPLSKDIDSSDPQESFDGRTVYFASHEVLKRVAVPIRPGTESVVEGFPPPALWTVSAGGIYFVSPDAHRSVRYFDFASKQIRPIFEVDKDFGSGLSVSRDGRWMLYSQLGDVNSDIMLVDHFH